MKNSVQLKLNLDLNSELGRNLFAGISQALAGSEVAITIEKPVIQMGTSDTQKGAPANDEVLEAAIVAEPKKRASRAKQEAAPGLPLETEGEASPSEEQAEEGRPEETTQGKATLGDIKAEIAKKVSKNREAIKAKITGFGAPNSDQMDPVHYEAFYKFLTALD